MFPNFLLTSINKLCFDEFFPYQKSFTQIDDFNVLFYSTENIDEIYSQCALYFAEQEINIFAIKDFRLAKDY